MAILTTKRFGIEDNTGVKDRSVDMQRNKIAILNAKQVDISAFAFPVTAYFREFPNEIQIGVSNTVTPLNRYIDITEAGIYIRKDNDVQAFADVHGFFYIPIKVQGVPSDNTGNIPLVKPEDDYADDAAAGLAGVQIGKFYHTLGVVKMRLL